MNTRSVLIAAVCLVLSSLPTRAHERLQGPTEVLYWDKAQTYTGYTFFGARSNTYLIDMEGRVAHQWPVGTNPHLLDNGHVLDAAGGDVNGFPGLKEVDWSGNTVWQYTEPRAGYAPHHDFLRIYNSKLGADTTLYLAAKSISAADCLAAGCHPANGTYTNAQVDAIVEVDLSGNVVWEWCFFDHGIQDFDASKANYVGAGKTITNYPGRLNLNLPGRPITNDWLHCNSIDYSTNLDQIVINAAGGEFYVIDHGNTFVAGDPSGSVALAAGAKGDFLYRFGDPARYGQGNPPSIQQNWSSSTTGNKQIGGSSQAQWIPAGCPGAGHFLVFNNGGDLFETTPQSYVFEINGYLNATTNDTGVYVNPPSAGYYTWAPPGHDTDKKNKFMSRQIAWMYYSMANQGLFSHLDSGAQRLPNGNTLVCASTEGHVFEITATGEAVWEYINPVSTEGIIAYKRDAWPMQNALFRAYRYPANHPALAGRTLTPRDTITGGLPSYLSAPSISGTSQAPATPLATNGVWVTSTVTNNGAVASVTLTYIYAGSTNTLAMADDGLHQDGAAGDRVYGAQIPTLAAGTTVRYSIAAQDDFGLKATDPLSSSASQYSYTVSGTASLLAPVIASVTKIPASPTPTDPVWVTAQVTDDVAVSNVTLTYSTGTGSSGGTAQTNSVFLETMRPTAVKPWTGDGCGNAWTVSFASNNPFEQRDGANYGTGNTNGLEFKQGTTNLTDSMLAPTQALDTRGTSGFVEFWLWADGLNGTAGWTFQLDSGSGYVTRLSELTGASHAWQPYHYDLQAGERINGLKMRWQFRGGQTTNRMDLDQISVQVVAGQGSGGGSTQVAMLDDGTHHDGAAGDGLYGAQIPAFPAGTTVNYYLSATDSGGLASTHPVGAPANTLSYTVQAGASNPVVTNQTVGLFLNTSNAWPGYTLMAPMHHTNTYLIDNAGQVVHQWASAYEPGRSAYLLTNGHLFRAGMIKSGGPSTGGGEGGRIEEFDWDGNLVWAIDYYSPNYIHHHDFKVLPNGNVLLLVAEKKTYAEVLAAGFNPSLLDPSVASQGYMLPDGLVEVTPTRPYGGTVVWEWHLWDHMIQDYDATKNNYGVVADHPERIDVNGPGNKIPQFWNHVNGIDYHPQLDQVMLSIRGNSELFVIDHQTTTAQAAGRTGGRYSKGGDILYRWGNPQQYNRGTSASQMLFQQHHTHWIETNCPGAGNLLIFNNGIGRNYSTINEIAPPVDAAGNYTLAAGAAFGPSSSLWTYTSTPPTNFYSAEISGCQRLPNGNTLICEGIKGNLFEVTSAGQTVWRYLCPVTSAIMTQGESIPVDPARSDQFMNAVFRVNRYGLDYPGLAGKDLTPRGTIEIYAGTNTQENLIVATSVSTVGDGIPDWWRALHFGGDGATTNVSSCATCDPDGDGSLNYREYVADTNPTDAFSCFRILSIGNSLGVAVSFPSSTHRTYSLYSCTDLTLGAWSAVPGQTHIAGTGGVLTLTDPAPGSAQRIFRISVQLP